MFIPAPDRVVVAQPHWAVAKSMQSEFTRSAWIIMPSASWAFQAIHALNGCTITVPVKAPSSSSSPFVDPAVDTASDLGGGPSFTIEARSHGLLKSNLILPDYMSHYNRIRVSVAVFGGSSATFHGVVLVCFIDDIY